MAVPKRKTSTARRDKRRTHWKMEVPAMATCDHCGSAKRPHPHTPQTPNNKPHQQHNNNQPDDGSAEAKPLDPRWEKLKALKSKMENRS